MKRTRLIDLPSNLKGYCRVAVVVSKRLLLQSQRTSDTRFRESFPSSPLSLLHWYSDAFPNLFGSCNQYTDGRNRGNVYHWCDSCFLLMWHTNSNICQVVILLVTFVNGEPMILCSRVLFETLFKMLFDWLFTRYWWPSGCCTTKGHRHFHSHFSP